MTFFFIFRFCEYRSCHNISQTKGNKCSWVFRWPILIDIYLLRPYFYNAHDIYEKFGYLYHSFSVFCVCNWPQMAQKKLCICGTGAAATTMVTMVCIYIYVYKNIKTIVQLDGCLVFMRYVAYYIVTYCNLYVNVVLLCRTYKSHRTVILGTWYEI